MDLVGAIRLCALWEVMNPEPSNEYRLRRVFRWYSRTFSTPLEQVSDIPIEDVLQAYYECEYEQYNDPELEDERTVLTSEKDELRKREQEDDEFAEMVEQEEAERARKRSSEKESKPASLPANNAPSELPSAPPKLPPDIKMVFTDLDDELNGAGVMEQPKKNQ